jgi:hypothetical protein
VLIALVAALVAVVLGLLGLGSLAAAAAFGGILAVAAVTFLVVLAVTFAAPATAGLALGRLLVRAEGRDLAALALGVLVVVLVASIPVAGRWLAGLLTLPGLGALLLTARPTRREAPQDAPA